MKVRHVIIRGAQLRFQFKGKSGVTHTIDLHDRRVSRIVKQCQELPGQELFQYLDDEDRPHSLDSNDVNDYIREIAHEDFTAKDFRTWAGTILMAKELLQLGAYEKEVEAKHHIKEAISAVAKQLGNTQAVCRKCYIHPAVIDAYLKGHFLASFKGHSHQVQDRQSSSKIEKSLKRFLKRHPAKLND